MEEIRKDSDISNETSINSNEYTKEYGYLNQLKGLIDFDIFEESVLCESNFFKTIARYISELQKNDITTREEKIKELIKSIEDNKGNMINILKNLNNFFIDKKISRYESKGFSINASLLKRFIKGTHNFIIQDGKIATIFAGIREEGIPERYYKRFRESGVGEKVVGENRKMRARAFESQIGKAEELKGEL